MTVFEGVAVFPFVTTWQQTLKIQLESSFEPRIFILSVLHSTGNYFMLCLIYTLECWATLKKKNRKHKTESKKVIRPLSSFQFCCEHKKCSKEIKSFKKALWEDAFMKSVKYEQWQNRG